MVLLGASAQPDLKQQLLSTCHSVCSKDMTQNCCCVPIKLVMQTLLAHGMMTRQTKFSRSAECLCAGPRGLWLEEFWRCHVVGGTPARMGTRGRVIGNAPATKAHLHTVFRCRLPSSLPFSCSCSVTLRPSLYPLLPAQSRIRTLPGPHCIRAAYWMLTAMACLWQICTTFARKQVCCPALLCDAGVVS